jgi:hypothetical protein
MLTVERSVKINADRAVVWAAIGAFEAISDWHPLVAACALSSVDGDLSRVLTLEGGGVLVELRVDDGTVPYLYEYRIISGPLPVKSYFSQLSATEDGEGTQLVWRGRFEASGVNNEVARATIEDVYRIGLAAIADRLSRCG